MEKLIFGLVFVVVYFCVFFIWGTLTKNNSVVDMGWGFGFVMLAWALIARAENVGIHQWIMTGLISIWGLRLTYHILKRNWGKPEDFRYANWRKEWGRWVILRAFIQVYLLQAILMWLISFALLSLPEQAKQNWGWLASVGLLVWMVGFLFESIGDAQLRSFIKKPENKGHVMTRGLWKFTRHPNYFGEAVQWWGLLFIALQAGGGIWAIISPMTIFSVLWFISIPLLEKKYMKRPEFQKYAARTSLFFPWFARKG
ncbi:DUF1295 domain-containing protein [Gottschalkiaceae bacterium SANA]|nr:DUF1295 domain-containing protein [Gottschalkiaceae bacterium SANA]